MGKLNVKKTAEINAGTDLIWKVMAQEFTDVSKWARSIRSSHDNPANQRLYAYLVP